MAGETNSEGSYSESMAARGEATCAHREGDFASSDASKCFDDDFDMLAPLKEIARATSLENE